MLATRKFSLLKIYDKCRERLYKFPHKTFTLKPEPFPLVDPYLPCPKGIGKVS